MRVVLVPGSDEWWMVRLGKALAAEEKRLHELDLWQANKPPLPVDLPDLAKPHYRRLLEIARVHLADLPVVALSRRLQLVSFRTAAAGDDDGDKVAEEMWSRCSFSDLKRWAITFGRAYTRTEKVGGVVYVTAESPRQTITEQDPLRPGKVVAGLKVYRDAANNRDVLVLDRDGYRRVAYRPGVTVALPGQGRTWRFALAAWDLQDVEPTGLDENALEMFDLEDGFGRFEKHLPTLRRINHTVVQRMVIIALQAFRQRALEGASKTDPDTGVDIDYDQVFSSDPGAMWILPAGVKLWESQQADMSSISGAIKDDVRYFSVGTGTPIHILEPDAANGSAEGAALLREVLVFDAEDVINRWRGPAAATLAKAFKLAGDQERADRTQIESIWTPPQRESLAARASAAVQMKAAGVPWRARMEIAMQAKPSEIRRWLQDRVTDAFLDDAGTGSSPAPPATARPATGTAAPSAPAVAPTPPVTA